MIPIRICILCITVLCVTCLYSIALPYLNRDNSGIEEESLKDFRSNFHRVDINWNEKYPLSNTKELIGEDSLLHKISRPFRKSTKRIRRGGEIDKILGKDYGRRVIEYGKEVESIMGWRIAFVDPFVEHAGRLDDGYLTWYVPRQKIDENIKNIIELYEKCNAQNVDFIYVTVPPKIDIKQDYSIVGRLDFAIQNKETFVDGLSKGGVPFLDLSDGLGRLFDNHHQMFFRTDHHWKPETALFAARLVAADINAKYGYDIDISIFDTGLYEKVIYSNAFLGSQGKKVTLSQIAPDDFVLIKPYFPVNINLTIPSYNVDVTGDFDVMLNPPMYENVDTIRLYSANAYGAYLYGDWPILKIHNFSDNVSHKKILLIKDSFANPLASFLCLGVEDLELIDLRMFNGSLIRYIDENTPDIVMVLTCTESLRPVEYDKHNSLFDYR